MKDSGPPQRFSTGPSGLPGASHARPEPYLVYFGEGKEHLMHLLCGVHFAFRELFVKGSWRLAIFGTGSNYR